MTTVDVDRVLGGRYRLTSLLHRGQGVETYLAQDLGEHADVAGAGAPDESRPVVLKVTPDRSLSESARRRLEHEGLVLGRMDHPSLVRLADQGRDGNLTYLVTPWVPGRSLAARLADGALSVTDTLVVARRVAEALCHAHDHGILHRDVKPANIVVSGEPIDTVVLIDFGLARSELLDVDVRDVPVGSVRYLAPEQVGLLPGAVDERSDLHALGLTLIECLRGTPVFDAERVGDVLRQQMTASPPPLDPPVPRMLRLVLERLVRRDPAERYQSAEALLHDLELLAAALESGVIEPTFALGSRDRRETLAEPSFVGREEELALLEHLASEAAAGRGGVVLLGAESGTGKSRLLGELERRTDGAFRRLRGQGLDQAAQRPFQVLTGVVRDLARAADDAAVTAQIRSGLRSHAEAAALAFPELAPMLEVEASGREDVLGPEEFGEVRTVRALAALVDSLGTADRPALVVLDDCQWADELSGRLVAEWSATRSRPCHVLVVAAYRSEELGPESVLRRIDAEATISLPPLDGDDIRELAASMAGAVPAEALDVTARLAEGSPFMAAAVLRGLVESGALVSAPGGWVVDPEALADASSSRRAATVLAHRITLLGEETQRLLAVGAVLGKEFEIAVAAALAGVRPGDVGRAVREATRRHLAWSVDGGRCAFVHDKIRETLLALLEERDRRDLHQRTAELLEARDPTRFFDLAFHFDAAGRPEQALPYALAAAEAARAQQSLEVVEQQYRIAERGAPSSSDVRRRIAEELGRVLMLRGRYEEAAEQLERARELATGALDVARIDGVLGELAFKRGDMAISAEALERAVRGLGQRMPRRGWILFVLWEVVVQALHTLLPALFVGRRSPEGARAEANLLAARLYSRLAHTFWFQRGSVATAFVHLRGLNLSERYPPTPQRAQAYSEHAPVMGLLPWYGRGVAYAERSFAIRRDLGDVWGQGQSLHFHGAVLYAASRWEECLERCREAVRLLDRTGDRWEVNTARWHLAYASYRLGDLATAAEIGEQVWRAGTELGDPQARGIGLAVWSKATAGRIPEEAIAPELARLSDDVHTAAEVLTAEALRLLAEDCPSEAVARLTEADELLRSAGLRQEYVAPVPSWLLTALRMAREASGPQTSLPARRRALRTARRTARRAMRLARPYRNNLPHALRECALIEAELGHLRRARTLLDRSVAVATELGARQELAASLLARADLGDVHGWADAPEDRRAGRLIADEAGRPVGGGDPAAVTVSLADRFDSLLSAGRLIASSLAVRSVLDALATAAEALLRAQDCVVLATPDLVRSPCAEDLVVVAGTGAAPSHTVVREALSGGGPVVVHDPGDDDASESVVLSGVRSLLCAPISVRGETVGCLYASHRDVGGVFGEDERRIAGFVTALAGTALENAEGFEEIAALTQALEVRVDDRTAALTDANRELDERLRELAEAYAREQEITERLRRLDQFKTELVAIAAHDLRTPLAIIVGFASTLHDHGDVLDAEKRQSLLTRIVNNTRRLSEFVENLLQFARIESGELRVESSPVDLETLLRRTIGEFQASEQDREFRVRIPQPLPHVLADESRQWQILMNLLSNAVKYSPDGTPIEVTAVPVNGSVEIAVRDHGAGIPESELPKLFAKFTRIDAAHASRRAMGTGLGLYICRSLVEAHGGRIDVRSALGVGTTFTYTVPIPSDLVEPRSDVPVR
jgi:signal transduction histidine kinase/tetratricopeptide (TPR) repeat protein